MPFPTHTATFLKVFPQEFYSDMQRCLPDPVAMIPIEQARGAKGYKERFVLELKSERLVLFPIPRKNSGPSLAPGCSLIDSSRRS